MNKNLNLNYLKNSNNPFFLKKIVKLFSQLNFSQEIFISITAQDLFSTQLVNKLAFF